MRSRFSATTAIAGILFAASLGLGGCTATVESTEGNVVPGAKRVFVSSQVVSGNLGGLSGADSLCGYWAGAAGLGGTWKAFLSTDSISAVARIAEAGPWYNVNRNILAFNNKNGFVVGAVNRIRTEYNANVTGNAWTGTRTDGATDGIQHCGNWTTASQSSYASVGNPSRTVSNGPAWMNTGGAMPSCFSQQRLYCFEQ